MYIMSLNVLASMCLIRSWLKKLLDLRVIASKYYPYCHMYNKTEIHFIAYFML